MYDTDHARQNFIIFEFVFFILYFFTVRLRACDLCLIQKKPHLFEPSIVCPPPFYLSIVIGSAEGLVKRSVSIHKEPSSTMDSLSSNQDQDLSPIVIKGYKYFNAETKENMLIKGIDYYPRPNFGRLNINNVDFFTEKYRHIWERDIPHFQALGANAIRLYSVDPNNDHSAFMCALNAAGIYVLVELASGNCPHCAISELEAPYCYPKYLKIRGEKIIREFSKYSNTLAFSAGNEVNHFVPMGSKPQWNAPCLKKFVRDMRAYTAQCVSSSSMRHVPVGLIMADSDRDENTLYYNCQNGDDDLEPAEWYGINTYVYCNANFTNFDESGGFKLLAESFESYNYSIPVLLTEFGCLSKSFPTVDGYQGQRSFHQAEWLGLPGIQNEFAGGFAFEYSIESENARTPFPFKEFGQQNYGVGYFYPENCNDVTIMCEYNRTPSFYNLKIAFNNAKAENLTIDEFVPDEGRTNRTQCPPHFPPLSNFKWAVDRHRSAQCPKESDVAFTCPRPQTNGAVGVDQGATPLVSFLVLAGLVIITISLGKFLSGLPSKRTRSALFGELWKYGQLKDTDIEVTTEESRVFKLPKHEYSSASNSL